MDHLDMNKIIIRNQIGSQKHTLCLNTIIALTEKTNHNVKHKDIVLTIVLDLAKAFNSISLEFFFKEAKKWF